MNIHQWLLPSKKNKFHPILLRPIGLMIFLVILLVLPFLHNITSAKKAQVLGYASNVTVGDLHALSNQERSNNGLGALSLNSSLNSAALSKANDMIAKNYWAHVSPDGTTPWAFISGAGYQYSVAGENLAKDFNQSSGVVAGWMASPTHRNNILSPSYRDVGYAVVNGVLLGAETTLVVAMYAAPIAPAPAPAQPAIAPQAPTPQATQANPVPQAPAVEPTISQEQVATQAPEKYETPAENKEQFPLSAVSKSNSGNVAGVASSLPVKVYNSFNWGQKVSLLLISTLILLFVMKHTLIWREQKRGFRHIWLRAHPLGQAGLLVVVFVMTIANSVGVIL